MKRSVRGAHSAAAWNRWYRENVAASDDGVSIETEPTPTYVSPTRLPEHGEAIPNPVDVAADGCGLHVLTGSGAVYGGDLAGERSEERRLGRWNGEGEPRAIAATPTTIVVAVDDPPRVYGFSREWRQTRWAVEATAPVALCRDGDGVFLLERVGSRGRGVVRRIDAHGRLETVVTGLQAPVDLDVDDDGRLYVLEKRLEDEEDPGHQVRRFDPRALERPPVPAADAVWIPPAGFVVSGSGDRLEPTSIAVAADGELVAGADPADEDGGLFAYRPARGRFDRQAGYSGRPTALAIAGRSEGRRLVAADRDGGLASLEAVTTTRTNPHRGGADGDAAYDGTVLTRFDSGVAGLRWGRLRADLEGLGSSTRVRVRYHATDDHDPRGLEAAVADGPTDLETVDGIGPRHAWRLRRSGIETLADLATAEPSAVATILGVEERRIPLEWVRDWQDDAEALLAAGEVDSTDLRAVDGVGPVFARRLRAAGVDTLEALRDGDPDTLAVALGGDLRTIAIERVAAWIDEADHLLADPPALGDVTWLTADLEAGEAPLHEVTGRYLWLAVDLVGSAFDRPRVRSIDVSYPHRSLAEELPAVYRRDEETRAFLEDFLAPFEGVFADVEDAIEAFPRHLDARGAPADGGHLEWLAGWLAAEVEDAWPEAAVREYLEEAPTLYRMRGTRRGLERTIDVYLDHVDVERADWDRALARERAWRTTGGDAGKEAIDCASDEGEGSIADGPDEDADEAEAEPEPLVRIVEHGDYDCLAPSAREAYDRLISCPQGFLVLCHPALEARHYRAIGRIVDAHRPVHTSGRAVALRPRTVLAGEGGERGYHTYLGINATLSERPFELEASVLGRETLLTEREPAGVLGVRSRLGEDAHTS